MENHRHGHRYGGHPLLQAAGYDTDSHIWLAYGDKKGHVQEVYLSDAVDKSAVLADGTVIRCLKYDALTGLYTPGTIEVDLKVYNQSANGKYFVLVRETFIPDPEPAGEQITVSVVTPKRMSIRLLDGTVVKNGESFTMTKGSTISFQMCTNNWDTDTYTDDGQGIAGTKVYTFTSSKNKDVLRTDTNTYFMAVRFHFAKGDYNKQTGIDKVLSTPLESLSVNLPLGATITADAYVAYEKVDSTPVFVETAEDKTISYTDYTWQR